MKLATPPKPKKGSTVYIISPSAGIMPFAPKRVERAQRNLEALGFKVVIAPNAAKNDGYVSGSIEQRVRDIHEAFLDSSCSLIIASIGGNHSNQLISRLDYNLIKKHPKAFIGYSDNTVLHYALATKANLQSYYGPCFLNQFGEFPQIFPYTLDYFKKAIILQDKMIDVIPSDHFTDELLDWFKDEDSKRARKLTANGGYIWWKSGKARGWAMPGAIPSINHLLGTSYMPEVDGAILMIDIPEGHSMYEGTSVAEVDSWLTDVDNAGVLAKINGLIIGRPYKYKDEMNDALKQVVLRIAKNYSFPILFNADFGHTDPMITIPLGSKVQIDSANSVFTLGA